MKTKTRPVLTFIGWQEVPSNLNLRPLALFNDESGSTIAKRFSDFEDFANYDVRGNFIMVAHNGHLLYVSDCDPAVSGFTLKPHLYLAWIFDNERPYNRKISDEIISNIEKIVPSAAKVRLACLSELPDDERWEIFR